MLTLIDAWIKAAIEKKTLEITYYSGKTKKEETIREVEPDFVGQSTDGKNIGLWGFCRLRKQIRCFHPENVRKWRYIGNSFSPNPQGRWQELQSAYVSKKLDIEKF